MTTAEQLPLSPFRMRTVGTASARANASNGNGAGVAGATTAGTEILTDRAGVIPAAKAAPRMKARIPTRARSIHELFMRAPSYRQFTTLGKTACESSLPESPEIVKHPAKQTLRGGRRRRIREPARVLCAECGDIPLGICRVIQNRIAQADDGKCFTARSR